MTGDGALVGLVARLRQRLGSDGLTLPWGRRVPTQSDHGERESFDRAAASLAKDHVGVEQVGRFRWRAYAPGLPNPREAVTPALARRRIEADLDHEWRTGWPAPGQRSPR